LIHDSKQCQGRQRRFIFTAKVSRAKLAEQLLESLDDPKQKEIDRLWADE
jgi:hypothetical protein